MTEGDFTLLDGPLEPLEGLVRLISIRVHQCDAEYPQPVRPGRETRECCVRFRFSPERVVRERKTGIVRPRLGLHLFQRSCGLITQQEDLSEHSMAALERGAYLQTRAKCARRPIQISHQVTNVGAVLMRIRIERIE